MYKHTNLFRRLEFANQPHGGLHRKHRDTARYWVHGLSRIGLCLVASIECPVGDSAKTHESASSDMLVNLMIQPVSSCCLRFQWYRLPALSLERLPVESSVYMGNGWFGYAVMLWVITVTTYVCLQPVLVESSVHMGNG